MLFWHDAFLIERYHFVRIFEIFLWVSSGGILKTLSVHVLAVVTNLQLQDTHEDDVWTNKKKK